MQLDCADERERVAERRPVPLGDLSLVLIGGVALLAVMAGGELLWWLKPLRLVLGLVYVLVVPGYCLAAALFARPRELDGPERLAVSIGLSVAIMPVIALVLDRLGWGIRSWPIAASLSGVILAGTTAAWYRRQRLPPGAGVNPVVPARLNGWWTAQPRASRVVYAAQALVLMVAVVSIAAIVLMPKPGERLTEFYLLGSEGLAQDYPREATAGRPVAVTVGIANHEGVSAEYRVAVMRGEQVVGQGGSMRLAPGATSEQPVRFMLDEGGDDVEVTFLLYRDGRREPYRSLRLWITVKA